jgi:CRP-like cAMP-binding protein
MTGATNQLIERLPRKARLALLAESESVVLEDDAVLYEAGERIDFVYFPTQSFVALLSVVDDRRFLEVGMVGREGMLGAQLTQGVRAAPLRAMVQGSGAALRVPALAFTREISRSASLLRMVDLYLFVLLTQCSQAAACVRYHLIDQRVARWLLMTQDRARSKRFAITHELLAYMLGVRRVGITTAAGSLQKRGFIEYHRGSLRIVDRRGLESAACSCYRAERRIYSRIFGRASGRNLA